MEDAGGSPALEVGFVIDSGASSETLRQIQQAMGTTEAQVVADAAKIEKATGGMINLGGATASVTSFGAAATRELQQAARQTAAAEKSGESLVRQLERQASTFGKTSAEIRQMKADTAALAAEQAGLPELAARIRAAAQALYDAEYAAARRAAQAVEAEAQAKAEAVVQAERAATALQAESAAAAKAAAEHAALSAMVRGSHDAQIADAAAAEQMRVATDAEYASVKRINAMIEESTRLYHAGATAPAEYARQQEVLTQRLNAASAQHEALAVAGGKSAGAMRNLAIQMPDVVQGLATGQKPLTILIQQGGQLVQVAMLTEGGLVAMAGAAATLAAALAPLIVIAGLGYVAFSKFQTSVKDDGELTRYRDSLGLTHKEMLQLSDGTDKAGGKIKELTGVTVTAGDVMVGIWKTITDQAGDTGNWDSIKKGASSAFDWIIEAWQKTAAGITAGIYGTFNAVKVIWANFPAVFGEYFVNAVNLAIGALNLLVKDGVSQLNGFIAAANLIPGIKIGQVTAPEIKPLDNPNAGAAAKTAKELGDGYSKAYDQARKDDAKFWAQVGANAKKSAEDRMKSEADAIKANRTPKKTSDHGLGDSLKQLDAQIQGQWNLAAAYQVSDAAAIKAEALQKAEEQAIRHKGETGIFYEKELALAVAQAAVAGAKHIADLSAQTAAQKEVNDAVSAGIIPASQMGQALQEATEKRQLLAALAVAEEKGWTDQVVKLKAELASLTKTQADNNAEAQRAQVLADTANGASQIARLQLEAKLIGASNEARAVAIAQLEAEQYLAAHPGASPAEAQAYIDTQKQIAKIAADNASATAQLNEQLRLTADLADSVGDSLSKAFGSVGSAIGDVVRILGHYGDEQQKIADQIAQGQISATAGAKRSADLQISGLVGIADAGKSLFKEHSAGYQAMAAAEKALVAIQLIRMATTIKSDAIEAISTAKAIAGSVLRAGKYAVEAVAKAIASVPFPLNIAAGAATAAALVALGISIFGGKGGGSAPKPTSSEDLQKAAGTGTILGSPNDKSASIAHSLELVAKNTDGALAYNNQMLDALKSIDASIGAMAATVAKQINVSGSLYDTSKLNIGSSGSAGFLGLFSSSTTRSLYDAGINLAATTVGNIVAHGISGQTYQIVEQIKKSSGFLGIGGGTKTTYQTTTGALPSDIAASIQSVIASLENGIVTAASAIGVDGAKAMLDKFNVNIGKLSFNGLDAQGIEDQLNAVFSSIGDQMTTAILPGIAKFQKVGEGLFETLERVASTVVAVDAEFQKLGYTGASMGIDVDMAIAGMFDSVSDFTNAADAYFETYYSTAEQAAAKTAQLGKVFDSLGLQMPASLDAFRKLVEAQDLTTAAGQETYATLLKLAPAFADLESSLNGAKSAADIASERADLQNQLLQLQGDTAAIRAAQLAKLDPSNRALQQQIYDLQDAQDAAKAAQDLADAWKSVGDSIMDEVKRIRGLTDAGGGSYASLLGQFNAATTAARAGDQDAAKSLPGLSQSLLQAAQAAATSRQELDRIQAQTAASLEATYAAISGLMTAGGVAGTGTSGSGNSTSDILDAINTTQSASSPSAANDDLLGELRALRGEVAQLRNDNNTGHAATASNTGAIKKKLDDVTNQSGGDAITVEIAA